MQGKYEIKIFEKRDLIHIAILGAIAIVIGVYLIATTVLIAKDGAFYIEQAQQFPNNPVSIVKKHPPGYPFFIFITHQIVGLFSNNSTVQDWVYSAQAVTLLFRLLALVPLYLIGKLIIDSKKSFWAILILIFLPYPAELGSDVIREWPHILFLSAGLLFLIWGVKFGKLWTFAVAGTIAAFGQTIRPECAQIVIYGIVWLLITIFFPKAGMSRMKSFFAMQFLLLGFAIPAAPYMKLRGGVLPEKLEKAITWNNSLECSEIEKSSSTFIRVPFTGSVVPVDIFKALGKLTQRMSENLMYFFMLMLVIGLYYDFCRLRKVLLTGKFFIFALMGLYSTLMVMLYVNYGYISRRHCMPIVVFTIFYIPVGLHIISRWLESKFPMIRKGDGKKFSCFQALVIVGICLCFPKLIRPIRIEKSGYRAAANWLLENTAPGDIIAVSDNRIAFYSNRRAEKIGINTNMISGGSITPGKWYHLVGVYGSEYQKLYINGKLVSSVEHRMGPLGTSRNNFAIGKAYTGAKSCFKGMIDEVVLYGKALSSEEVVNLYNYRLVPDVENPDLIGYWRLEEVAPAANGRDSEGMIFDGKKDYLDLSGFGPNHSVDELTVSIRVRPEILKRTNWILGNGDQFRVGIRKSKVYFWVRAGPPVNKVKVPINAAYIVFISDRKSNENDLEFDREVRQRHLVWVDKHKKEKKLIVYEIL